MAAITPRGIAKYYAFVEETVRQRTALERGNEKPTYSSSSEKETETERRKDIFHYLSTARDPETGALAMSEDHLVADANLLVIAGSDTTSTVLGSIFFYLTRNPRVLEKLYQELRHTFSSVEEIQYGAKLSSCTYLQAVIDESFRLGPAGCSELPRDLRAGGIVIDGDFYPKGTTVGVPYWSYYRSTATYNDALVFRPERWIVSVTKPGRSEEELRALKHAFTPFGKGVGSCVGRGIAALELGMCVGRTVWRMEMRKMEGDKTGEMKGEGEAGLYQMWDAYLSVREGPIVQVRGRV